MVFIQRLKQRPAIGMVTYTDNVFGLDVSVPFGLRGAPAAASRDAAPILHGTIVQIDFEMLLDRLDTIGLDVNRLLDAYRCWRRVPPPSGPAHG